MSYWQVALILGAVAAVFVLWPLTYMWQRRDSGQYAQARASANTQLYEEHVAELRQQLSRGDITEDEFAALQREQQRALLEDVSEEDAGEYQRSGAAVLVVFAVIVPLAGWLMYQQMGAQDDWEIYQAVSDWRSGEQQGVEFETQLRHDLARRLEERPDNAHNWYTLANLAMNVQDYDQAVSAYRRIIELEPQSPQILAELAQAIFLQAGNQVTPEVRQYTQQALEIQPNMPTALGLAGIDAFQQGYFERAINYWSRAVELLGENAPGAQALMSGIARAQAELDAGGKVNIPPDASSTITVSVALGENVEVDPSATVFVYVRAFKGPRMPLAIQRFPVAELPRQVVLDKSMSMAPGMDMSQFETLEVVARISESGNAIAQSGDWQAVQGPVSLSDDGTRVELAITEQLP